MRIKPCHGCPLKVGCEVFPFIKEKLPEDTRGFVSVAIKCGEIVKKLAPGTRIMLSMPIKWESENTYEPDYRISHTSFPATITYIDAKGSFNAVMDKNDAFEDKYRFRKRGPISRINAILNEPPRQICMRGNPIVDGKCDTQFGEECSHIDYRDSEGSW